MYNDYNGYNHSDANSYNRANRGRAISSTIKGAAAAASSAYEIFAPVLTKLFDDAKSVSRNISQSLNQMLDIYRIDRTIDIPYVKNYRKKNGSQVIIAQVGALLENDASVAPNDDMHLLDDEYVIAEYDELHGIVIQSDFIRCEKIANNIMENLNASGGILFLVDKVK